MRLAIVIISMFFFAIPRICSAAPDEVFEVETEGAYRLGADTPIDLARQVAFYSAKRAAVELAGRYLSRKGLIPAYELREDELYSLAAREIEAKIVEEKRDSTGPADDYRVRITALVKATDFLKAEIEDKQLAEEEASESYSEEMEQPVSGKIDPGRDIAKAYRLQRQRKWRLAMIYLNHIEKKYPNWDSIYMAKAFTHYVLHKTAFMEIELRKACRLGNQVACSDLKHIRRLHEQDFGISTSE